MGRSPCCVKEGLNRGAWTALEDQLLIDYINAHGEGKWRRIPKEAGLKRCGKSCRLRWLNYLRPDIKRGNITQEEEDLIIRLHKLLGNRWSLIAGRIPGRTDNEIKNYWNTTLGKKVINGDDEDQQQVCRSVENKKKNKNKNKSKPLTMAVESIAAVPTRAVRCNRVVVTSDLVPHKVAEDNNVHGFSIAMDKCTTNSSEEDTTPTTTTTTSEDWVLDFDVGKLFNVSEKIPDNSDDYWEVCEFGVEDQYGGGCSNNFKWPSVGSEPISFSEEMLKDWMRDDCFHHQS